MAKIDIYNQEGKKIDDVTLSENVFGIEPNVHVMHEVCRAYLASLRQGTHQTKTRGKVRGGGSKPWRQKGTGRARQGTIRAPQWRGGGTVFGPHPRSYDFKVPRKVVKLAMRSALSAKYIDDEIRVVDSLEFENPRTKDAVKFLKAMNIEGKTTLVIDDEDYNTYLSFRNIPGLKIIGMRQSNTYDLINNKNLIFTLSAVKYIEEVLA